MVHTNELQGRLRITAPVACFSSILLPVVSKFEKEHPHIKIELLATGKQLDLVSSEADIAFRVTEQPSSDLVGYSLGRFGLAIYGRAEDLKKVEQKQETVTCIDWIGSNPASWIEQKVGDKAKVIHCNSLITMAEMTKAGYGISQLQCVIGDADPDLQRLPDSYYLSKSSLWVLTHIDVRTNAKVRAFRNFAINYLSKRKNILAGII